MPAVIIMELGEKDVFKCQAQKDCQKSSDAVI